MIKLLVVILFCLTLFINCSEDPGLPEGYKLLCSVDGKKYTLMMPGDRMSANVWNDEIEAKEFAWKWEYSRIPPSSKYEWKDCEK